MHTFFQDLRLAVRQIRNNPRFASIVVLTLALGIGANTAIFSCLNGFLRPLPVRSPEQIVVLAAQLKDDETGLRYRFSFAELNDLRRQADRFSDIFGFNAMLGGLQVDRRVKPILYSTVTGNYFSALGVKPAAGRLFLPGEGEGRGMEAPVVLGYSFWQRTFGGDPGAIGKEVRLDGFGARVIGVVPKGFLGTWAGAEMDGYLPVNVLSRYDTAASDFFADRTRRPLTVMGRLKPGVSLREAQSSVDVIARRLERQYPDTDKDISIRLVPEQLARPVPVRFMAESLPVIRRFLLALAALVLLLACMNVVNLVMVRASARQREMAIRAALGSGRGRLLRQMLTESCVLAFLGVAAGLAFGKWGNSAFVGSIGAGTSLPVNVDYSFDWRVFSYALAAAVFTVLAIGLVPALQASRIAGQSALRDGGWGGSAGRTSLWMRSTLVVAQVGASLTLLIVAGMLVRGLQHAQRLDLGFQADHVLNVRLNPRDLGYSNQRARDFYRELKRRVGALPGVQSVSLAFSVPLGYIADGKDVYLEGRPVAPGDRAPHVMANSIDGDYFGAMRIPLVRGRAFTERDDEKAPLVAIVNQTMARAYWPGEDPIGKRFRFSNAESSPWLTVVGVTGDMHRQGLERAVVPQAFLPHAQATDDMMDVIVRTSADPQAMAAVVQSEIQSMDKSVAKFAVTTVEKQLAEQTAGRRFQTSLIGLFSLVALLLAAIGIYGLMHYLVVQRTNEIGVRMALGARAGNVLALVLRQGLTLASLGIVAGMLGALGLTHLLSSLLYGTTPTDPLTFATAPAILLAVAAAACWVPARRAARIDPMLALRGD